MHNLHAFLNLCIHTYTGLIFLSVFIINLCSNVDQRAIVLNKLKIKEISQSYLFILSEVEGSIVSNK